MPAGNSQSSIDFMARLEAQNTRRRKRKPSLCESYKILESMGWFWRMVGIFPFTMKGSIASRRYELNKFLVVYSFLLFAVSFGTFVLEIREVCFSPNQGVNAILDIYRATMTVFCAALSTIWRVIRHKELLETLEKMRQWDVTLGIRIFFNDQSSTKKIRAYVWITFVSIALLASSLVYAIIRLIIEASAIYKLFWIISWTINTSNLAIFVTLVGVVGLKFRALNKEIKNVVTRTNASSPELVVNWDICAEKIRVISRAHFDLCDIGKRINCMFGLAVIVNVTITIIIVITTFYSIFYELGLDGTTNYGQIFHYIWIKLVVSIRIIVIVVVCNWTTYQGNHAGILIHEIRIEKKDSQLFQLVKSFSLQLHHQKLEFSASGFVPIDSTLLQAMIANIITYLVILIQFHPKLD